MNQGRFAAEFEKFCRGFLVFGGSVLACAIVVAACSDTPDPKEIIEARLLADLRAGLPHITIFVSRNDEKVASAIARKMRAGETVPDGADWLCRGIPSDRPMDMLSTVEFGLTDYDRFRWALKHSLLRVQDVGPYKVLHSKMKTQKCVVLAPAGADKNVTIKPSGDDPTVQVVTVKVAQIDDFFLGKIQTETPEELQFGRKIVYATRFSVSFVGSVKNFYGDLSVTPGVFSGTASLAPKPDAKDSGDLGMLANSRMPTWTISISP